MSTPFLVYRADIDGLRALAVLSVVLFHIGIPGFSGGFVGVDVFFAISGYLISRLLLAELQQTGTVSLSAFFARRVRRLLPALLLVITVTLALSVFLLFPEEIPRLGKSAMAVPLLAANHYFIKLSGGYFDPSVDLMPLLHTWSLSVEEQFYLLWPLLFLGVFRCTDAGRLRVRLMAMIAFVIVASFALGEYLLANAPTLAYFLMPARAWEFAIGAWFGLWAGRLLSLRQSGLIAGFGLLVLSASLLWLDKGEQFPGWRALLPVVAVSLLMWAGAQYAENPFSRLLGMRWLTAIGKVSYSWYLWHWPLLALGRAYRLGERDLWLDFLLGGVLSLLLAVLTYRFVEQPVRLRRPGWFSHTRGTLWLGLLMSLLVIALAALAIEYGKKAQTDQPVVELAGSYQGDPARPCVAGNGVHSLPPVLQCTVGPANQAPALLLWGDSHADHYSPLFDQFGGQFAISTLRRERGSCPPVSGVVLVKKGERQQACADYSEQVMASLPALAGAGLKGVVLSSRWGFYQGLPPLDPGTFDAIAMLAAQDKQEPLRVGQAPLDQQGSLLALARALRTQLAAMARLNLRVLIIGPSPELPFTVPGCVRRKGDEACVYSRQKVEQRRRAVWLLLQKLAAENRHVRIVDPVPLLCGSEICRSREHGYLQYTDSAHLSARAVQAMQTPWITSLHWVAGMGALSP